MILKSGLNTDKRKETIWKKLYASTGAQAHRPTGPQAHRSTNNNTTSQVGDKQATLQKQDNIDPTMEKTRDRQTHGRKIQVTQAHGSKEQDTKIGHTTRKTRSREKRQHIWKYSGNTLQHNSHKQ